MKRQQISLKRCSRCERSLPKIEFQARKRSVDGLDYWCRDCKKIYMYYYYHREGGKERRVEQDKINHRVLKREVMGAYGGDCQCCGESELMFLTIDHINQDGANHRRELGPSMLGFRFYRWLKQQGFPPGYQVLCYNCNCGSFRNGGICPHKQNAEA